MWQQNEAYKQMPLILCHFSMWSSTKWSLMCSFGLESLSWRNNIRNLISKKARMKYGFKSQYNLLTRCTAGVTMEIEPEGPGSDHKIHPSISLAYHQPDKFRTCDRNQFSFAGAALLWWLYEHLSWQRVKIQSVYANRDANAAITHTKMCKNDARA